MNTKEGVRRFVEWTKLKVRIHISEIKFFPRERQVWWVSIGQNIGVEINGKNDNFERPILIIKRYNNDACLVVPLSSRIKVGSFYYHFLSQNGVISVANLSQIRTLSTKRFVRKIGKVSENDFLKIKELLKNSI